jgi:hypothetical protein
MAPRISDQDASGSNAKYAPISPNMIAIVSRYVRMAPSRPSDDAEPIQQAFRPLCSGAHLTDLKNKTAALTSRACRSAVS